MNPVRSSLGRFFPPLKGQTFFLFASPHYQANQTLRPCFFPGQTVFFSGFFLAGYGDRDPTLDPSFLSRTGPLNGSTSSQFPPHGFPTLNLVVYFRFLTMAPLLRKKHLTCGLLDFSASKFACREL